MRTKYSTWAYLVAIAATLLHFSTSTAPAQVPDKGEMLAAFPDAAKAGAPPAIKPGFRMTYFGSNETIEAAREPLHLNENGHWVFSRSGGDFKSVNPAVSYSVVRVDHIDQEAAALTRTTFLFDPLRKTIHSPSGGGLVTHSGCAMDYWVHPRELAKLKETDTDGLLIRRMPYVVNNRRYNAIRYQATDPARGYLAYMYDLDSGLMIFHGAATNLGRNRFNNKLWDVRVTSGWLVESKQVDIPWASAPAPAWIGQFKQLQYQGSETRIAPGVGPISLGLSIAFTPIARGDGWLRLTADVVQTAQGLPPSKSQSAVAAGPAAHSGLWIGPKGIANLKRGQVIDTDEFLKIQVVVADIGREYVTISEVGPNHRLDTTYSVESGMLMAVNNQMNTPAGQLVRRWQLTGQR